ncbi:uncharacterized protein G2W53_005822 [Senna tora]|uniref:Retrotransposon Copia-like N-terminal domain-containing protein n=1 Tax=Senna tora TaxID=362788 RepID=A0A834X460_9FABA|nr:uncharacterized protein G2W53_005822 [Senna tora]
MDSNRSISGSDDNEKSREDRERGRQEDQEDRSRKNGNDRRSQEGHREEDRPKKNGERPWALLNSDQPGMSLVVSQLTSTNFLGWSTAIKTALEAKGKLGFIDRTIEEPTDEEDHWKWKKADSMVKSWIVNSMTKELADFFVYCRTTRELWDELEDRFGKACGPLLYQIQREVASTEQGLDSLVTYYGKLRKWWDELDRLKPTPRCTCGGCKCGINKRLEERESSNKLLQFLMGLHQRFKTIRTQILNFDPLPTINKAFAMVSQDEVQMEVKDMFNPLEVTTAGFKKEEIEARRFKAKEENKDKVCTHCQMKGHVKEECFKIVGYPEWFKDLRNQKKKGSGKKILVAAAESPLDDETETPKDLASMISQIVRQEISKAREEKVNVAYLGEFTGNISSDLDFRSDWIVDTGASSHMCSQESLMHNIKLLDKPIHIHLPNGTNIQVERIGSVNIGKLKLEEDRRTRTTLAEGKVNGNIYWLRTDRAKKTCSINDKTNTINNCTQPPLCWHSRLGTLVEDNEEHPIHEGSMDPINGNKHDDSSTETQEPHNDVDDLTESNVEGYNQAKAATTIPSLSLIRPPIDPLFPALIAASQLSLKHGGAGLTHVFLPSAISASVPRRVSLINSSQIIVAFIQILDSDPFKKVGVVFFAAVVKLCCLPNYLGGRALHQ